MFWNWLRWQCVNTRDLNDGEIPKGTLIDEDEFTLQLMKMLYKPLKCEECSREYITSGQCTLCEVRKEEKELVK